MWLWLNGKYRSMELMKKLNYMVNRKKTYKVRENERNLVARLVNFEVLILAIHSSSSFFFVMFSYHQFMLFFSSTCFDTSTNINKALMIWVGFYHFLQEKIVTSTFEFCKWPFSECVVSFFYLVFGFLWSFTYRDLLF